MKHIKVGILGIGNVAVGTYKALEMNCRRIEQSSGVSIDIIKILNRSPEKDRGITVAEGVYTQDPADILDNPQIDIVVELIGGIEPASEYMARALRNGKHVVTANKAAIAAKGDMLQRLALENGVMLRFEASVGGGVPILNALSTALLSNDFDEILGIVNGTTNYILTQMTEYGLDYEDVLKDAQEKGFAERDPSGDVEGIDVANKLSILMSIVFGIRIAPEDIPTQGITSITKDDINFATQFGYKIKLLATAKKTERTVECHVQPSLVPFEHPLASVSNEFNALFVKGNAVDDLMFYGKGAGPLPTGSAVLGDIIEIARAIDKGCAFDSTPILKSYDNVIYGGEGKNKYYLKLIVEDRPGVLGSISSTFGKYGIGIASMMQRPVPKKFSDGTVPLVFILHQAERNVLDAALEELYTHSYVSSLGSVIRVEE